MRALFTLGLLACALAFTATPTHAQGDVTSSSSCPPVVVEGHGSAEALAPDLQTVATHALVDVRARLGVTSCDPVRVELLPGIEEAQTLDPPWHLPPWAAGAAEPQDHRIVVAVTAGRQRQDRERVLVHELAHEGVHEAAGNHTVPRWFDEGVARSIADEDRDVDDRALAHAHLGNHWLPLLALVDGFPPLSSDATLAYAIAGRAVRLMEDHGGPHAVARVLAQVHDGVPFDDALVDVTGRRTWQLDLDVQRSVTTWRALALLGRETDVAYGLASVLVVVGGARARRRVRERMVALGDLHDPWPMANLTRWTVVPERRMFWRSRGQG
jgi:hypothetical protein